MSEKKNKKENKTQELNSLLKAEEELQRILADHDQWIKSGMKKGEQPSLDHANLSGAYLGKANLQAAFLLEANLQRAYLVGANLQGALLENANLKDAILLEANLQDADLRNANLNGADLHKANLQGANLYNANLENVDIQDAKLESAEFQNTKLKNAKSLLAEQLAGLDLTGATLPEDIHKFEGPLAHIADSSKNVRNIFITMLLACMYSWLSIGTTTDVNLLTNSSSSKLPIIGTEIPIVGIYFAAPLILFSLYIYLHFYLLRLYEALAILPAKFPDGRALHEKVYPWLLNWLVCAHVKKLKEDRPSLSRLQNFVSIILAWWLVPATLLAFWGRYLYRHGYVGTAWHILLLTLSIFIGLKFYRLVTATLSRDEMRQFNWKGVLNYLKNYNRNLAIQTIVRLSFWTKTINNIVLTLLIGLLTFISWAVIWRGLDAQYISYRPLFSVNLYGEDVSTKPINWTGKDKNEIDLVKGANLKGRNLLYVLARESFLVKADLRNADLRGAILTLSDLEGANLEGANLNYTYLGGANLRGANLLMAHLESADLTEADLRGANLTAAHLIGAELSHDVTFANLSGTKFIDADLRFTDLDHTNFNGANLRGANFYNALLGGADLSRSLNLTKEQIKFAITDKDTKLPPTFKNYSRTAKKELGAHHYYPL